MVVDHCNDQFNSASKPVDLSTCVIFVPHSCVQWDFCFKLLILVNTDGLNSEMISVRNHLISN